MMKGKALALLFILFISLPAFSSEIRLMGMGDLQGVIDDETDYNRDVTFLPAITSNHVLNAFTDNNFDQRFPANVAPTSGTLQDFERYGRSTTNNYDILLKLDKNIGMNVQYTESGRDFSTFYYDSTTTDQLHIDRRGSSTKSLISLGVAPVNWFSYGVGYTESTQHDDYDADENGPIGDLPRLVDVVEDGSSGGMFFGMRFGDNFRYLSVGTGSGSGTLTTKDNYGTDLVETTNVYAPSRAHAVISYKMPDELITFKCAGYSEVTPVANYTKGLLGMEFSPSKGIIVGIATIQQCFGDFTLYTRNIGFEQHLNNWFTWRAGLIDKNITYVQTDYPRDFFSDYTFGLEIALASNLFFEGAYKNYSNIYGGPDTWSSIANYYLNDGNGNPVYNYSDTTSRNDLFIGGLRYVF